MAKKIGNKIKKNVAIENTPDMFFKNSESSTSTRNSNNSLNCFLIQINYANIYPYFDRGLLLASKYFLKDEKTEFDLQSKFPDFLVLTKNIVVESKKNQLFIDIILTEDEVKNLISSTTPGIFFYDKPIPVSRVKTIYYSENQPINKVLKIIDAGGASFIPNSLIEQLPVNTSIIDKFEFEVVSNIDFNREIVHYDKLMGMFSFMKNTNLFYGIYSNYSSNYFLALSIINQDVKKYINISNENPYIKSFEKIINNREQESASKQHLISSLYDPNVLINKNFLKDFIEKYKNEVEDSISELENILKKIDDPLAKTEYLDLLAKDKNLKIFFQVAYIASYGDKIGNSKLILKNTLAKEVPYSQAEIILAFLGLYFGYRSLNPVDTIQTNSGELAHIINKNENIKFRLNSRLDYITIESIYQFTFNGRNDNTIFDYIVAPDFSYDYSVLQEYRNNSIYDYSERQIFDIKFILIKQKDIKESILKSIREKYPDKIPDFYFLLNWIRKYYAVFYLIRIGKEGEIIFKEDLLQFIEKNVVTDIPFLQKCISYDLEFNIK